MENCIFIFFERKTNLYSLLRPDLNLRSGSVILYKSSLSIIFPGRSIRMKKLSKFGRSTLSLLLCLTMLLTTFCFFDIGSVGQQEWPCAYRGRKRFQHLCKVQYLNAGACLYQGRRNGLGVFSERNIERHGQRADFRNRRVQLLLCNGEKCNYFNNRSWHKPHWIKRKQCN